MAPKWSSHRTTRAGLLDQSIASNILKSADDTKIFKEVRDNTDCASLQRDLDNVVLWDQKWQMEFNVKKCKVVHVGRLTNSCECYPVHGRKQVSGRNIRERLRSLDIS